MNRDSTFRINYANIPKKPTYEQILAFVVEDLELRAGEVLTVQCSRNLGCVFVKTSNPEIAQRVCEKHDNKHEVEIEGKKYPLRITLEDGAVEVKLTDLSESISNESIRAFLERYGDVISITEQDYTHPVLLKISTGVRLVKMIVKQNIASFVTIDGETTMVSYFGQRQTCRHCHEYIHPGMTCVQNKKLLLEKSYADAAKRPAQPNPKKPSVTRATKTATWKPSPVKPMNTKATMPTASQDQVAPEKHQSDVERMPPPAPILSSQESFPCLPPVIDATESRTVNLAAGQRPRYSDGNETDESAASTDSAKRRLRPKKQKQDIGNEVSGENIP